MNFRIHTDNVIGKAGESVKMISEKPREKRLRDFERLFDNIGRKPNALTESFFGP